MPAPGKTAIHTEEFMKFIVEREAACSTSASGKKRGCIWLQEWYGEVAGR